MDPALNNGCPVTEKWPKISPDEIAFFFFLFFGGGGEGFESRGGHLFPYTFGNGVSESKTLWMLEESYQ